MNKKFDNYKFSDVIDEANKKGLITSYEEFSKTEDAKKYTLSEEEVAYYTSLHKEQFKIGDIVFVSNYTYKNGERGTNHIFVIIDNLKAIDITYFGFLLSSQISKEGYKYNEKINKNDLNRLHKNSIVKCDDLISISEANILFKIGEVTQEELMKFKNAYREYLSNL